VWVALLAVAAVVLSGSWYNVSGKYTFHDQRAGIDLAIASVVLAQLVGVAFVILGRRVLCARRDSLLAAAGVVSAASAVVEAAADRDARGLIAGEGLTRYHRADCQLAVDRNWPAASRAEHQQHGRRPCGVCRP
jgi:hypothetical protein